MSAIDELDQRPSEEWKTVMRSWYMLDVKTVAAEIYRECRGDARKLLCVPDEKSIYGRLARKMLGVNTEFARNTLYAFWTKNMKHVRIQYAMLKYPHSRNVPACFEKILRSGTPKKKWCWCKSRLDGFSVQCNFCKDWYHVECCGITEEQAIGIGEYSCLRCTGSPLVPALWMDSEKSGDPTRPAVRSLAITTREADSIAQSLLVTEKSGATPAKDPSQGSPPLFSPVKETPRLPQSRPFNARALELVSTPESQNQLTPILRRSVPLHESFTTNLEHEVAAVDEEDSEEEIVPPKDLASERPAKNAQRDAGSRDDGAKISDPGRGDNDTSGEERLLVTERIDSSRIPMDFSISVARKDWKKVVTRKKEADGSHSYEVTSEYPAVFSRYFNEVNPICVIRGQKKKFGPHTNNPNASYYTAYCVCKGKSCGVTWNFTVKDRPSKNAEFVTVRVTGNGTICHFEGQKLTRFLRGDERKEAIKELEMKKPSMLRRDKFGKADKRQLEVWNYNLVKELKTYQQANVERRAKDDLHTDAIMDLIMTYFKQQEEEKGQRLPGFIQLLSLIPFAFVMFLEDQVKFLRALSRQRDVVLFLDATGTLCKRLPKPFPQTRIYYYALVAKPRSKEPVVPVMEFYSGSHDTVTISTCLGAFLYEYRRLCNIRGNALGIARIEIDFSKALLAASCNVFLHRSTEEYINYLWTALTRPADEIPSWLREIVCSLHTCRLHVERFFGRKVERTIPRRKKNLTDFLHTWMKLFIRTKTIQSIQRRMTDFLVVTGSDFVTPEVSRCLRDLQSSTNYSEYAGIADIDAIPFSPEDPFYKRSMFGKLALAIAEQVQESNFVAANDVQNGTNLEPNEFKSEVMFNYAITHIFPYTPILNQTVFKVFGQVVEEDTTNNVENWIGILKNLHFDGETNMKAARLARSHKELIKGSIAQAIAAIRAYSTVLPGKDSESDEDEIFEGIDALLPPLVEDADPSSKPRCSPRKSTAPSKSPQSADIEKERRNAPLSPEKALEVWGSKKQPSQPRPAHVLLGMPVIPTGGSYEFEGSVFPMFNTCNVDTTLQILYYIYNYTTLQQKLKALMDSPTPLSAVTSRVMELLDGENFNEARIEWGVSMLGKEIGGPIDFEASEVANGTSKLAPWFSCFARQTACLSDSCGRITSRFAALTDVEGSTPADILERLNQGEIKESWCKKCHSSCHITYEYTHRPDLLVYTCYGLDLAFGKPIVIAKEQDLQLVQTVLGLEFEVLAYTMYTGNHFYTVVVADGSRYTVDGQFPSVQQRKELSTKHAVSSVWLSRKSQ